jgi:hypothetical protein
MPPLQPHRFMGFLNLLGLQSKTEKRHQWMIQNGQEFIDKVKSDKSLPIANSTLFLSGDEKAILEERVSFSTPRSVSVRGGGGVGIRVAKGVYAGGYAGQSESHKEWRTIDVGTLTLTSKRVVFVGGKENRNLALDKILSVQNSPNEIHISAQGKDNELGFTVTNPFVWYVAMGILRTAKDPFALNYDDITVSFGA